MKLLICLLLLGLWDIAVANSCPQPYARYSKDHTYCKGPNKSCKLLSGNTVSKAQAEEIIKAHNELRRKVANGQESTGNLPSAANMLEMQWDDELADIAQKWALQCIGDHDCKECRQTRSFRVGQNYFGGSTSESSPAAEWTTKVQSWYSEVKYFDDSKVDQYVDVSGPKTYGHFTQVVWATTWRVGCGYAAYTDGGMTSQKYFCNYGPGANLPGAPVYQRGSPCSKCPGNTECNNGLCRVQTGKAPIELRPPGNYLYYCDFSDESACDIKNSGGKKPWTIIKTTSGGVLSSVLEKGETSEFTIGTTIKTRPNCLRFWYTKGPNVAGEQSGNEGSYGLKIGGKVVHRFKIQDSAITMQSSFPYTLSQPYQLVFEFKALTGSQYMEITKITIKEGDC